MYFLVITQRTPQFDAAHAPAHKAFMTELKNSGQVIMSGPFSGGQGGGAYVLRADSLEQAEELAFSDPLKITGSSTISVRAWDATIIA